MKIPFRTRSKWIDLADLKPEDIDKNDIAFSLARTFRFNGITDELYSVAQHSVLCSLVVPQEYALAALLHDVHEYILGDITRPAAAYIHEHVAVGEPICTTKENIDLRVSWRFNVRWENLFSSEILFADRRILATEMLYFFGENYTEFESYEGVLTEIWTPKQSEKEFLDRLEELT